MYDFQGVNLDTSFCVSDLILKLLPVYVHLELQISSKCL